MNYSKVKLNLLGFSFVNSSPLNTLILASTEFGIIPNSFITKYFPNVVAH